MKSGDAVTVVLSSQLVLIECHFTSTVDYFLAGVHRLLFNEEGVTWLRGYHTPDEECVSAARTCQALREQETGVQGTIGVTGPVGPPGVSGAPFGMPFGLYPPQPAPPSPGPAPTWIGYPVSPQPQIGQPWPGVSPDNTHFILTTSNTEGLM